MKFDVYRWKHGGYPKCSSARWITPSPSVTFQFSNQVSEIARRTREEVVKVYRLLPEGQGEGMESIWKRLVSPLNLASQGKSP